MSPEPDAAAWSYQPGRHLAVLGGDVLVVLPASERSRAARLWERLDAGAALGEVLDLLLGDGLSALPGFAVVSWDAGGRATVLVRGAALRVEVRDADGEEVVVDGTAAATWAERTVEAVVSVAVRDDEPFDPEVDAAPTERVRAGLLRVGSLSRGEAPQAAVAEPAEPEVLAGADSEPDVEPEPATASVAVPAEGPAEPPQPSDPADVLADAPAEPAPWGDEQGADTIIPGSTPLPPPLPDPAPDPAPEQAPDSDHDGETQIGADASAVGPAQPGIAGQPPAPASLAHPVAVLELSDGQVVEVDRLVIVGRAPEAHRFAAADQPRLVTVPSPKQEISSTHLEVRPGSGADHGSAVVTDLGSTNGSVLAQPGLDPEDLPVGVAVQLIPGAELNLGDGVTIRVTRP